MSRKCQDVSFVISTICISSSRHCIGRFSGTVVGRTVSFSGLMSSPLDSLLLVLSDKLQMLRVEIVFWLFNSRLIFGTVISFKLRLPYWLERYGFQGFGPGLDVLLVGRTKVLVVWIYISHSRFFVTTRHRIKVCSLILSRGSVY